MSAGNSDGFDNPLTQMVLGRKIKQDQEQKYGTSSFPVQNGQPTTFDPFAWLANLIGPDSLNAALQASQNGQLSSGSPLSALSLTGPQTSGIDLSGGTGSPPPPGTGSGVGGNTAAPPTANQGSGAPPAPGTGIGPGGNQTPDVPSQNLTPPSGPPSGGTVTPDVTPPAQTNLPPLASTGGYSSKFDLKQQESLAADPMALARLWMKQQGIGSMTDNPLAQAMLAEASRAQGLFGLLTNTNSGMQAGSGTYAQNFIDFFDKYMKNPVVLSADKAKQLLAQALQQADTAQQGGNQYDYFANALGLTGQAGLSSSGQATQYQPTLADETARLKEMLVSALGGSIDPNYLKGITEGVDRSTVDYQNSLYDGNDATSTFIDWMLKNSKAPFGIGAAPAGGQ